MKYFLLVWVGAHLLSGPEHPVKFDTKDDCITAAMLVATAAARPGEDVKATCYDHNGAWVSTYSRGSGSAPL